MKLFGFQGDVLMKFDGVPVANEGTVPFQAGERIAFTFLASQKYSPVPLSKIILKKA